MNDLEIKQAGDALIAWFKSQGLCPADAAFVMSKVIAAQLVSKAKTREAMTHAADVHRGLLLLDMWDCLNG